MPEPAPDGLMAETSEELEAVPLPVQARARRSRAARADARAEIEWLFRAHGQQLGRFLARVVSSRSLADDLMQETFLAAVREKERVSSLDNPEAWLFALARNRALHAMRSRRRAARVLRRLAFEPASAEPDPADAVAVRDFLDRHLDPEDRILLILRYVHGFQSPELGRIVGRSPEAVRQQLSRARRRLIRAMDEPAGDDTAGEDEIRR